MSGATSFNGFRPGISGNIFNVDPLLNTSSNYQIQASSPTSVKTGGEDLNDPDYDIAFDADIVWHPFESRDHNFVTRDTTYSLGAYEAP
jgi:hypothetical protein